MTISGLRARPQTLSEHARPSMWLVPARSHAGTNAASKITPSDACDFVLPRFKRERNRMIYLFVWRPALAGIWREPGLIDGVLPPKRPAAILLAAAKRD